MRRCRRRYRASGEQLLDRLLGSAARVPSYLARQQRRDLSSEHGGNQDENSFATSMSARPPPLVVDIGDYDSCRAAPRQLPSAGRRRGEGRTVPRRRRGFQKKKIFQKKKKIVIKKRIQISTVIRPNVGGRCRWPPLSPSTLGRSWTLIASPFLRVVASHFARTLRGGA